MTGSSSSDIAQRYNRSHAHRSASSVIHEIWRKAYGDDYPAEAQPNSFVTLTQLRRITEALNVGPSQTFIDLGCGRGGSGLWVARETGASLVGIDLSTVAVEEATRRAGELGMAGSARFQIADCAATSLPDQSFDGALSTDALFYGPDYGATFREIARILRPGSRLAFTSWELDERSNALNAGPIPDYRPFLEAAGFGVMVYDEAENWEPRWRAVFEGILASVDELAAESGQEAADRLVLWAKTRLPEAHQTRQVFVVAEQR
jgi:ubiquinone/menaquinone biosynthesis C-methylase UbiE